MGSGPMFTPIALSSERTTVDSHGISPEIERSQYADHGGGRRGIQERFISLNLSAEFAANTTRDSEHHRRSGFCPPVPSAARYSVIGARPA